MDDLDEDPWELSPTDALPTVDDFRLLDELDTFNQKIAAAIGYLRGRGHHQHTIEWALSEHVDLLRSGGRIPALVARVALEVDERSNGTRRRELAKLLAASKAMKTSDADTLRKKLSDARAKEVTEPAPAPRHGVAETWDEAGLLEKYDEMRALVGHEMPPLRNAQAKLVRLRELGVLDKRLHLRESLEEIAEASESSADASESNSDG